MNFSDTTAKASLTSNRSMSSSVSPALASTLRAAGTGALSMSVGSSPMLAVATTRARGVEAVGLGVVLARPQHRRGAVDDARGVAGVVDVLDVEVRVLLVDQLAEGRVVLVAVVGDGREARRQLRRATRAVVLRPGELLVVEGDGAVEVVHRDEAPVEAPLRDGDGRRGAATRRPGRRAPRG